MCYTSELPDQPEPQVTRMQARRPSCHTSDAVGPAASSSKALCDTSADTSANAIASARADAIANARAEKSLHTSTRLGPVVLNSLIHLHHLEQHAHEHYQEVHSRGQSVQTMSTKRCHILGVKQRSVPEPSQDNTALGKPSKNTNAALTNALIRIVMTRKTPY